MKELTRASGARVRGLGAGSGPWLSPSIVRGPGPLSDFSVLISSARNQPSGSQSCEEAQMGQRQGTEPKVRLRRGQAASSAVGANRGRAAVSGHLHWKQRNQQPRMASPATGRRRRPSMRLPVGRLLPGQKGALGPGKPCRGQGNPPHHQAEAGTSRSPCQRKSCRHVEGALGDARAAERSARCQERWRSGRTSWGGKVPMT